MVDIHSHVLPGLDDGARTIEESLEMLRLAAASGTTDIVATPHANSEFAFDDERVRSIFREVSHLSEGFIRLYLGCDFHLSYMTTCCRQYKTREDSPSTKADISCSNCLTSSLLLRFAPRLVSC